MGGDQGFNREPQTARCVSALSTRPTAMKSEKVFEMRSEREASSLQRMEDPADSGTYPSC
jgi:hypothetical protein